jgi:hypothetical protein
MHTTLSIVDTARASSPEGSAGVFGVFVLFGGLLVKGQYPGGAARRRRKKGAKGARAGGGGAGGGSNAAGPGPQASGTEAR